MTKTLTLTALALACALSQAARADVRTAGAWMQNSQSSGFASARVDLDDEALTVSVMIDFQSLNGACTGGRVLGASGRTLCVLSAPASATGFAFGAAAIDAAAMTELLQGLGSVELSTTVLPGELTGTLGFGTLSYVFPMTTAQAPQAPQSSASGNGYVFAPPLGGASFSAQLHNLQGSVTSIEVRRGAWYGDTGPLLMPITTIGQSGSLVTCSGSLASLTTEERRDLSDGLCYMLVKTTAFPEGELRGQIRSIWLGDEYCPGRPNSVAFVGARLHVDGSPLAQDASVRLHGEFLPPNKVVLPIVGLGTGHVYAPTTLGGVLCVAGAGTARLGPYAGLSSGGGTFDAQVELNGAVLGGLVPALAPDVRLNFQLWYRDPNGATTTNLSSAVSMYFR